MKILKRYWFFVLVILATSFLTSRDLFRPGYFPMHDDLQVGRLYQMDLCVKDGQIPCRWVPDMGYSYGYPLFNYYPPFPYCLGEIFHLLGLSFIDSVKLLFIAGFLVSGVLMFLFTRKLWGDWGGLLSAILYLWAPYHAVDVYVRGAMNEFWALAFLPGVYWAIYEIVVEEKGKNKLPLLALFFGFLLLSHNLMAFIFMPTFIAFALLLIWLKKKDGKEKIIRLALGGWWGLGLAAFFTLPVLVEKKYVHVETMLMGYFNFLAHYVSIGKMLFTRFWGYGSSGWLQETGMPFQVGFPHWPLAVLVLSFAIFGYWRRRVKKEVVFLVGFFFALFLLSLFLVHPRSNLIWQKIPLLAYLQFPWRFLTLVIFAVSVLGGGLMIFLKSTKWAKWTALMGITLAVSLNFSFFRVEKILKISDEQKLFSALGWRKLQTDAIFDYLPKYAQAPPAQEAPAGPILKAGAAEAKNIQKGSDWYSFQAQAKEEAAWEIPVYYFPGWKAWLDNQPVAISYDNPLGLITVKVPVGNHELRLKFTNTPVRTAANLISLVSWLVFPALVIRKIRYPRFK
ncbi:MAG TPA: 6-pyruvoyl-tetrahydropterin synthase-related protein [Clostridia bacterium]|nr:6-pyruvoyl-tetrahydropterin synthase-related protein [Clostridia bacterium]